MARIEKTVFISYRRTDVYTALAVYENLKNQGYDVFFDYRSISSGDFEQIITSNIRARAHFLLILTPTALDRCNEPGDWLRREIEIAMDEKRNIVPLIFKGFRFGNPFVTEKLTGKLKNLSRYNGLNVHEDYFDEAMQRLCTQYLNIPLDTILHPVSTLVQKVVREEQVAADEALEHIENVQDLVKQGDENPIQLPEPDPIPELKTSVPFAIQAEKHTENPVALPADIPIQGDEIPAEKIANPKSALNEAELDTAIPQQPPKRKMSVPNLNFRLIGGIVGGLLVVSLLVWGGTKLLLTTSALGIGSTMTGKDGMRLLYVPAGEFTMGSDTGDTDEKPIHKVTLDAFWIDKTEVTNAIYAKCVDAGVCDPPSSTESLSRDSYYGNFRYDKYPVIYVNWNQAKTYCEWAGRRLPTEAEWEKAASWDENKKEKRDYPWGSLLEMNCFVGNFEVTECRNNRDTSKAGNYPNGASPSGALDMAGNVWEWVNDRYDSSYYQNSPTQNPQGPASGQERVIRGGSFYMFVLDVTTTYRTPQDPSSSDFGYGFRCAMSATP